MKFKILQILTSLVISITFLSGISNAAQKTIVKEYSYQAGELDSKVSSRTMAMEQIKRLVLEEAGTYVAGTTVVKGLQLESDQVIAMTAGIVSLKVIDESWNGKVFYMKAEATIDPDDIAKKLENMAQNQNQIGELENAHQKIDELQTEVERLKADMLVMQKKGTQTGETANTSPQSDQASNPSPQQAPDQAVQQNYATRYNDAVNQMRSLDMVQNSYVDINSGDYYTALDTLNNAIVLSPQVAPTAFIATSIVYVYLNVPQEAIASLKKAVRLTPDIETRAILTRVFMYERSGDDNLALEEVNRAIRMDPREPWAYRLRAGLYIQMGMRSMGRADIGKARKLYLIRQLAYQKAGPATQEPSRVITITSSSVNRLEEKPAPGIRSREEVRREQEQYEKERLERTRFERERFVREQQHPGQRQQERQIRMAELRQQKQQRLQQERKQGRQSLRQAARERQRQKANRRQKTQQKESK